MLQTSADMERESKWLTAADVTYLRDNSVQRCMGWMADFYRELQAMSQPDPRQTSLGKDGRLRFAFMLSLYMGVTADSLGKRALLISTQAPFSHVYRQGHALKSGWQQT
jgi:hypothetical protein